MQQKKENFLQTKKGKIIVSSIVGVVILVIAVIGLVFFLKSGKTLTSQLQQMKTNIAEVTINETDYENKAKALALHTKLSGYCKKDDINELIKKHNEKATNKVTDDTKTKLTNIETKLTELKTEIEKSPFSAENVKAKLKEVKDATKSFIEQAKTEASITLE